MSGNLRFHKKFLKLCKMKKILSFLGISLQILEYIIPLNSLRTPRNRFYPPRSLRNVKLPFLDSSIPRGVKFSEELPSLHGCHHRKTAYMYCGLTNITKNNLKIQTLGPLNLYSLHFVI